MPELFLLIPEPLLKVPPVMLALLDASGLAVATEAEPENVYSNNVLLTGAGVAVNVEAGVGMVVPPPGVGLVMATL